MVTVMVCREGIVVKVILRCSLANRLKGFPFALDRLGVWVVDLVCVVKSAIAVV